MIAVLHDRDDREQARPGDSLVDRLDRFLRANNRSLVRTIAIGGVLLDDVLIHEARAGRIVQLLGDFLADRLESFPAAGAGPFRFGHVVFDPFPFQMGRDRHATAAGLFATRVQLHVNRRFLRFGRRLFVRRHVKQESSACWNEFVRLSTVTLAEEKVELMLQLFDHRHLTLQRRRLLGDQLLSKLQLVG